MPSIAKLWGAHMRLILVGSLFATMLSAAAIAQSPNLPQNQTTMPRSVLPPPGSNTIVPGTAPRPPISGSMLGSPYTVPTQDQQKQKMGPLDSGYTDRGSKKNDDKMGVWEGSGGYTDRGSKKEDDKMGVWRGSGGYTDRGNSGGGNAPGPSGAGSNAAAPNATGPSGAGPNSGDGGTISAPANTNVEIKTNSPLQVTVPTK